MRQHSSLVVLIALVFVSALAPAQESVRTPTQLVRNEPGWFDQGGFGKQVTGVRDFDGDGFSDYAVAAPTYPTATAVGRVYIYSGRTGTILQTFDGSAPSAYFGRGLADVGDVDGDGTPDLAISSHGFDAPGGGANHGRIQCFSGASGAVLWTIDGTVGGGELGKFLKSSGPEVGIRSLVATHDGWSSAATIGSGRIVFIDAVAGAITGWASGQFVYGGLGWGGLASEPGISGIFAVDAQNRAHEIGGGIGGTGTSTLLLPPPVGGSGTIAAIDVLRGPTAGSSRLAVGWAGADSGGFTNNGTVDLYPIGNPTSVLTLSGPGTNRYFGGTLARARDVDGDGIEEVIVLMAGPSFVAPNVIQVYNQSGILVDEAEAAGASSSALASIDDVTGDGRGEWLNAIGTGATTRFDCSMFSLGLDTAIAVTATETTFTFSLDAGPLHGGETYFQSYGASGAAPGIVGPAPWPLIPLNYDALSDLAFTLAGTPILPNPFGVLSPSGTGTTTLMLPAATVAALTLGNVEITTAFIAAVAGSVTFASNPETLDF